MSRREVRVFFDWGHQWPLWEANAQKSAMEPRDLGLSDELSELLREWRKRWIPIANFDIGEVEEMPPALEYELYEKARSRAVDLLRREMPADIDLLFEDD